MSNRGRQFELDASGHAAFVKYHDEVTALELEFSTLKDEESKNLHALFLYHPSQFSQWLRMHIRF